jgi:hypothetical protein
MTELVTLDELQQVYGIRLESEAMRARYASLVKAASNACQMWLGRDIGIRELVEYHDGTGRSRFVLDEAPVVEISKLAMSYTRDFSAPLSSGQYRVDPATGIVTLYGMVTPVAMDVIMVVYRTGYDPIPDDIKAACVDTLQLMARRVSAVSGGVTSRTVDGGTEQFETTGPTDYAKLLLRPYQRGAVR